MLPLFSIFPSVSGSRHVNFRLPGLIFLFLFGLIFSVSAQDLSITGRITSAKTGKNIANADVLLNGTATLVKTNSKGEYILPVPKPDSYLLTAFAEGLKSVSKPVEVTYFGKAVVNFELEPFEGTLKEVKVEAEREKGFGVSHLNSVEGTSIYEAKKSEVVMLDNMAANLSTNNSRQVYAKVAGLNIWESDGAGIQLGIGGRGLSPQRTSNFNTRQNGYDISADALGYPESYYTPPTEALDRIEVVRGAASLQYGTQFGGMLNFVMKKGPEDKKAELTSRQTIGSFGLFNSYNSLGGTVGKLNYYTFYQHKKGNGWRPNSEFEVNSGFMSLNYKATEKLGVSFDYTLMDYVTQQPGGLTDRQFEQDPRQSNRERNWFKVNWNLAALSFDYRFSDHTKLNIRNFGLMAERDALGFLGKINRPDPLTERDLLKDKFRNYGSEARLIHHYEMLNTNSTMLVGVRYYKGLTDQKQGRGSAGYDADFNYLNPDNLEYSDYDFPSRNISFFAENIFNLSPQFSITPGIRLEYINTAAQGYFRRRTEDLAGNVISDEKKFEDKSNTRSFLITGIGASYKPLENIELYGNFSENYRAVNFNDIRVVNENIRVDENLKDEKGSSADLGFRGNLNKTIVFDLSLFYLTYANKISQKPPTPGSTEVSPIRTNIGRTRNLGMETYAEADILKLIRQAESKDVVSVFSNITFVDARYVSPEQPAFDGNQVELAPKFIAKTGVTYQRNTFKLAWQYSYNSSQFTDATNSIQVPDAVIGIIPAYYVMDISAKYGFKKWITLESGINNLTNNMYFTRRASGYPGPGILPSDGRNYYVTLQVKI